MAIVNFIPQLWSAKLQDRWTNEAVFPALANREYEGTVSSGNTVKITGVVAPTVKDYKAAGRTTTAEAITDTAVELVIDQEKSFDFYIDDIDATQAAGSLQPYTDAAGDGLVEDTDKFLASLLVTNGTVLAGTTPTTGAEAFDLIRDLRKAMNKAMVPTANRVVAVNAEFEGLLLGADSKLTAVDVSGDSNGLRSATIGNLLGFRVVASNHLPEQDFPQLVGFDTRSMAFASQINQTEAMRAQDKHADRIRGLHVYGGKVIRPLGVHVFTGN